MGVRPSDAWRMTLREFLICWEGYLLAQRDIMMREAWKLAQVATMVTGKVIDPALLLGEKQPEPEFATADEFRAYMREQSRIAKYGDV